MKPQTHIERNLVKIPVDHVNSFKSEKAFQEAMETEGHFANELPDVREDIYAGIWKEAQGLKEKPAADKTGGSSKNGNLATDTNASGTSTTASSASSGTTSTGTTSTAVK